MEAVLIFLFGGCLRSPGDEMELYTALGIESTSVTQEEIRTAFRRRTLQLHPDKFKQRGSSASEEDVQRFLRVKEAFDVLSDPTRRRRYHQVGLRGLRTLEDPSLLNPTALVGNFLWNESERCKVVLFLLLFFGVVVSFPVIFAMKIDGSLDIPWVLIWTPMWFVDVLLLLNAVLICKSAGVSDDDEQSEAAETSPAQALVGYLKATFIIILQLTVILNLDAVLTYSWLGTFTPWYALEVIIASSLIGKTCASAPVPDPAEVSLFYVDAETGDDCPPMKEHKAYYKAQMVKISSIAGVAGAALRFWQAFFLALKLDGEDWNWAFVFLPAWVYFFFQLNLAVCHYMLSYRVFTVEVNFDNLKKNMDSGKEVGVLRLQYEHLMHLRSVAMTGLVAQLPLMFMAIMLVCRLEVAVYSTFFIILPVVRTSTLCIVW